VGTTHINDQHFHKILPCQQPFGVDKPSNLELGY
jgi:hypothetical protein